MYVVILLCILEGILFLKISFESKSFYRSTNLLNQFVGQEININILNITFPFKSVPVWMTKTYGHSICDPEILLSGMVQYEVCPYEQQKTRERMLEDYNDPKLEISK